MIADFCSTGEFRSRKNVYRVDLEKLLLLLFKNYDKIKTFRGKQLREFITEKPSQLLQMNFCNMIIQEKEELSPQECPGCEME